MLYTYKPDNFSKDPAVVFFGGRYYLYHTTPPANGHGHGIAVARSEDMEHWETICEIEPEYEYEKDGYCAPGAIVLNGAVHLFYQTYGEDRRRDAICHAVSYDGVSFQRNPTNPVFKPSESWCCGRAIDADVCVFGDKIYLYFATRDHEMNIQKIGAAWTGLQSDFSRDSWHEALIQSVLTPEMPWEKACIEAPATIVENGKIYMFYGGAYNYAPQQIGCAVSEDGVHFDKISSEPVLPNGKAGEWNSDESGHPFAFRAPDGRAWLFYQGTNDMGRTWYLSKKEIIWENGGVRLV